MSLKAKFVNHKAVKKRLQSLMPNVQKTIRQVVDKELDKINRDIQEDAPVRTGDLKETGRQHKATGGEVVEGGIGYGRKKKAHYAAPVEEKTAFVSKHARTKQIHEAIRAAVKKLGKGPGL